MKKMRLSYLLLDPVGSTMNLQTLILAMRTFPLAFRPVEYHSETYRLAYTVVARAAAVVVEVVDVAGAGAVVAAIDGLERIPREGNGSRLNGEPRTVQ